MHGMYRIAMLIVLSMHPELQHKTKEPKRAYARELTDEEIDALETFHIVRKELRKRRNGKQNSTNPSH